MLLLPTTMCIINSNVSSFVNEYDGIPDDDDDDGDVKVKSV